MADSNKILVAVLMGSKSDWDTMGATSETLAEFDIPHECRVFSAHRTPGELEAFMKDAKARGCRVFIGGAGGAAHLAGVIASKTVLPVLGVPIPSVLNGLDSLLSTVQMPDGIPVGTLAIGRAGAINAALLAVAILGTSRPDLLTKISDYRKKRAEKILEETLPQKKIGF